MRFFSSLVSLVTALLSSAPPENKVCFGDVGCFNNDLPCHNLEMASPEVINTRFYLFTRYNRNQGREISWRNVTTIDYSNYDATLPTKFIIHGWIDNTGKSSFIDMKNTLLAAEAMNVILVDWRGGSLDIYDTSVQNIRVVGRELARLAYKLHSVFGSSLSQMHAIGHSLGAHAAGYAGSELEGFGRITGLDPAGPFFRGSDLHNNCTLDKTDALFVDVIHTDSTEKSSVIPGIHGLGLQEELGHQDFYPNGGRHMPGCLPFTHCSHYRAVFYFTESISTCSYNAAYRCKSWERMDRSLRNCTPCDVDQDDCPTMGYRANPAYGIGTYYLQTTAVNPFC